MSKADDLQLRTDSFADLSIKFVDGLPDTLIARRLGAQDLDASTSVAANYRAARRGRSHDEFTAKIGLVFWVTRLVTAHIHSTIATAPLLSEAEELAKIFYASARTARSRRRKRREGDPPPR